MHTKVARWSWVQRPGARAIVAILLQGLALGRVAPAQAAICDASAFGCPPAGTCTITGTWEIEDLCALDFGDLQVVLKGTLRAEEPFGYFDIIVAGLSIENGKLLSPAAGDDAGGNITVTVTGAFAMSGANPTIDVGGDAGGGNVEVTAASIALGSGSIKADGGSGADCGDAGSITLEAETGALTTNATLSATTPGIDCAGGSIALTGTSVTIAKSVSISGGSHSFEEIVATSTAGDLTVTSSATLSANGRGMDEGSGGDAGAITLDAEGSVFLYGAIEATGSAPTGSGGAVTVSYYDTADAIEVSGSIDVTGKGDESNGGTIDLLAEGAITVAADLLASGGKDAYAGNVRIFAGGAVTVAAASAIEVDAGLGTITISAGPTTIVLGDLSVSGVAGGDGGTIDLSACAVTVGGLLDARASGGGSAGNNLLTGGTIHVLGTGRLLAQPCPTGDCNLFKLRTGNPTIDPGAIIDPPPTVVNDASVIACCGNGTVDPGEECDDGGRLYCDDCSPTCTSEPPDPCADDGNSCTGTACIPSIGCEPLDGAACDDDGDPCTDDVCAGTTCTHRSCEATGDTCQVGACTASGCEISELPDGTTCSFGGLDSTCEGGSCLNPCEDGDPCTTDSWNGFCFHSDDACTSDCTGQQNGTPCSDGMVCTTGQCQGQACIPTPVVCDPCEGELSYCFDYYGLRCYPLNPPVVCTDDNNPCTADSCDSATGACVYEPLTGLACTDDGNACTSDICEAGACAHPPIGCDDNDACTADSCEADGTCHHEPVSCNDGDACTTDSCGPTGGCEAEPVSCDDGDACTDDSCNPASGCETVPVSCDDGDACTVDGCDPPTGCSHTQSCGLDHFKCYRATTTPGAPRFAPVEGVTLEDIFETLSVDVKKRATLCPPANKNGENPSAPSHEDHLAGYLIKASASSPRFVKRMGLEVTNQFGTLTVDAIARDRLLVPSAKSLSAPPGEPTEPNPDHFECYRVRVTRGAPAFVPIPGVSIADQLESGSFDVKKPTRLCNPVNKNGEDPSAPGHPNHLLCYQIKASPGSPAFQKRSPVYVANQFGDQSLDLPKVKELCVPSTVVE